MKVAPFAGAWIEIYRQSDSTGHPTVAPFAGAWIEIYRAKTKTQEIPSLPLRERGLKYHIKHFPLS